MPLSEELYEEAQTGRNILAETVKENLTHRDYARVTELADLYKKLISGDKINDLLKQFVRREDKDLFSQRVALTKAITPSVSSAIMNPFYKVGRVNPVKKQIDFEDTKEFESKKKNLDEALTKYNGDKSLDKYLETRFVENSFIDPNAFIITEFDPAPRGPLGEMLKKVNPRPLEISAFEAINFSYKNNTLEWLIIRLDAVYILKDGKKQSGYNYTIYLPNVSIRLSQVDKDTIQLEPGEYKQEGDFEYYKADADRLFIIESFEHKTKMVPAVRIGYRSDLVTDGRTCVNPMHDAMPYFEKSIKTVSEFDLTMALHAFPQKFQYVSRCLGESAEVTCSNGYRPDGGKCKSCQGSGMMVHTSAQDGVFIRMPKDPNEMVSLDNLVHYEKPPIDLLKFQDEFIKSLKNEAVHAVFNSQLFSRNEVVATATEKKINLESVYDTLFAFAERYSEIYRYIVKVVASLRDISGVIVYHQFPKDFKFKTVEELLNELDVANRSGAPGYVRKEISRSIAEQQFMDKPEELRRIETKQLFFPFGDKDKTEIALIISNGLTTKYDEALWANFDRIFLDLEMEAEEAGLYFYDFTFKKQRELLDVKVNAIIENLAQSQAASIPFRDAETDEEDENEGGNE